MNKIFVSFNSQKDPNSKNKDLLRDCGAIIETVPEEVAYIFIEKIEEIGEFVDRVNEYLDLGGLGSYSTVLSFDPLEIFLDNCV